MKRSLENARIDSTTTASCVHVLAAAAHRQWRGWEEYVIPALERGDTALLDALEAGNIANIPPGLAAQIYVNAENVIALVRGVIVYSVLPLRSAFALPVPDDALVQRKLEQLASWVNYARSREATAFQKWMLQCRTPFIYLTPTQQRSDYDEAVRDLRIIAAAGGLVLSEEALATQPLEGWPARRLRWRHRLGAHEPFMVSEGAWSTTCQACHYPGPNWSH